MNKKQSFTKTAMKPEDYRPKRIDFVVTENEITKKITHPFTDIKQVREYIKQFVATSAKIEVDRYMDNHEIDQTRNEYIVELEINQPKLEKSLSEKTEALEEAKAQYNAVKEQMAGSNQKIRDLVHTVNSGVKPINLDMATTWRIPIEGMYYYVTYIDGMLKVANVSEIPDSEKQDLLNSQNENIAILDFSDVDT